MVRLLHTLAVPDPLPLSRSPWMAEEARQLGRLMRSSLEWTGFYDILPEERFPQDWRREGVSPSATDRARWSQAGAYRVVRSTVRPTGEPGAYILQVRVVELERFSVVDLAAGDVVVRPGGRWSAIAAWVDSLLGHDTGVAGSLGTRVVATFRTERGVKEVGLLDPTGGEPAFVTRNGSLNLMPAWGPGGTIGYMSYIRGNTDWLVDGEPVSTRPGLNAAGTWSPDGRWLALSVAEAGNSEVVILDPSTGQVHRQVTAHTAVDTSPAWSPEGDRVAFVSDRSGNPQVWVADLRSGRLTRITRGGYITSPTWSPLGDRLVYSQKVGPGRYVLVRHDLDTGKTMRLTATGESDESPCYSPDGRYLIFVRKGGDRDSRLWMMHDDGNNARPIPTGGLEAFAPDWGDPYGAATTEHPR